MKQGRMDTNDRLIRPESKHRNRFDRNEADQNELRVKSKIPVPTLSLDKIPKNIEDFENLPG
jgi:hypothetical protein